MFSKFSESLSAAKVLIVAGYSFRDARVNSIIEEALILRRGELRLVVVNPAGFRLEDSFPLMFEMRREGVATILDTGLSESLKSDELQLAVRKSRKPLTVPPSGWATKLPTLDALVEVGKRDVEDILGLTLELQVDLDRLLWQRTRSWQQMGGLVRAKTLPACEVASACEPLIACGARIVARLDQILASMKFGAYFGSNWLERVNLHPSRVGKLKKGWAQRLQNVEQWTDYAFSKFMYSIEEFREGIADSDYGKSIEAPDNWSMSELVLSETSKGVREMVHSIGELFEGIGFERGLPSLD